MEQPEIEVTIDHAKERIALGEALERLQSNQDFQAVIVDGYLKQEALRSVGLLAKHAIKQAGRRPDVIEDLVAKSNLQDYFARLAMEKDQFEDSLKEHIELQAEMSEQE
jgi:alkylation response protein AidB-like acyl-CoA dehydrogenase